MLKEFAGWRTAQSRAASQKSAPRPTSGHSDHAISLDFVRHVRGVAATTAESDLLQEAIDGCCHDPDQDAAS